MLWRLLEEPELAPELVHISDLYVTSRQIVAIAREVSNYSEALPPQPDVPMTNTLACPQLRALGIKLGGEPLLLKTIHDLVQIAQAN